MANNYNLRIYVLMVVLKDSTLSLKKKKKEEEEEEEQVTLHTYSMGFNSN